MENSGLADQAGPYEAGVLSLIQFKSDLYSERTAFWMYQDHRWKEITYSELAQRVRTLSKKLVELGVERGERIAILSESRPEWAVAFFAAIRAGAIVVPLDIKLTNMEITAILEDCEPRLLFVSSELMETARMLEAKLSFAIGILVIDKQKSSGDDSSVGQLESATFEGREREFEETALIVYTSGTTGAPKGVMISFGNLAFQVASFENVMKLTSSDVLLSMLPLNHLLELTCGLLGVLYAGGAICYCRSLFPDEVAEVMRVRKVTAMITVPLFLKMFKTSIEKEVQREGVIGRKLFRASLQVAAGLPHSVRRLLFNKAHKRFGGRLKNFISGGAPLDADVATFFDRLGIPIYQGYGLTETSPVVSVNTPAANKLNSVGRPMAGVRVRILNEDSKDGEGEIVTAGPHVMKGYYKRPDLTEQVIDREGWFYTGDLGRLDEDGFLFITGRLKNLIVLGSGKKVNPGEVEAVVSGSLLIKEVCVVGRISRNGILQGTEEVCAVVVPSESLVRRLKDRLNIAEEIRDDVARLTQVLAPYKRPSSIYLRFEDLPKTTMRKIKRVRVLEWLEHQEEVAGSVE